jgi:hypothetical protein
MIFNYGPTNPGSFGYRPGYPIIQGHPMPNTPGTRGPDMRFDYSIPGAPGGFQYGNTSVYGNQLPGAPGFYGPYSYHGFAYPGPNGPYANGWYGGPGTPGMSPGFNVGPDGIVYGPGGVYYGPGGFYAGHGAPGGLYGGPGAFGPQPPIAPVPGVSPIPGRYPSPYGPNPGYGYPPAPYPYANAPGPHGFSIGNMPSPYGPGYGVPGYGPFDGPPAPGGPARQGPYVYGGFDRGYPFGPPPDDDERHERRRLPNPARQEWGSPFGDEPPWMQDRWGPARPNAGERFGLPTNPYGNLANNNGGFNYNIGTGNPQGGNNQGNNQPQTFPVHPCARSPRDFFMWGEDR